MLPPDKLRNPPIIEALLDIQVAFPTAIDVSRLKEMHSRFETDYPLEDEERITEVQVVPLGLGSPQTAALDRGVRGYRFISTDRKQMIQFRQDGFTFNRLEPYESWEKVTTAAKPAWEAYRISFPTFRVIRIGVRYINRIRIDTQGQQVNLDDYFTACPRTPLPGRTVFSGFVSHSLLMDLATGFGANCILARQLPLDPNVLEIILDIDVFTQDPFHLANTDPFSILETMRELKNSLFFKSITPKTRAFYE